MRTFAYRSEPSLRNRVAGKLRGELFNRILPASQLCRYVRRVSEALTTPLLNCTCQKRGVTADRAGGRGGPITKLMKGTDVLIA